MSEKPTQQIVEIGLSGDTLTEILSGLILGDKIATKTVTTSGTATKTSSAPSLFGSGTRTSGTGAGAGGNAARALGR